MSAGNLFFDIKPGSNNVTRHLTKLGSRALKFDMGPLVAAASLQHVAGIENSAMQLVLMRCSLDLTLNCEPCRLTTRS